jgi:hypothetical protein
MFVKNSKGQKICIDLKFLKNDESIILITIKDLLIFKQKEKIL